MDLILAEPQCDTSPFKNGKLSSNCTGKSRDTCTYVCQEGFTPHPCITEVTCSNFGNWSVDLDSLCPSAPRINVCSLAPFRNGKFYDSCFGNPGVTCGYICADKYTKNPDVPALQCLSSGNWSSDVDQLCKPTASCSVSSFTNGKFSPDCFGKPGDHCGYKCADGYDKNPDVQAVACLSSGNWSTDPNKLCSPAVRCATSEFNNGKLLPVCEGRTGSSCNFKCAAGYVDKTNTYQAWCLPNGKWTRPLDTVCEKTLQCQIMKSQIGAMASSCSGDVGSSCDITCKTGYGENNSGKTVSCLPSGKWTQDINTLCQKVESCTTAPFNHGTLSKYCPGKVDSLCGYECENGFAKHQDVVTVTCLSSGNWSTDLNSLCTSPSTCKVGPFSHGYLASDCQGDLGSMCDYHCVTGYVSSLPPPNRVTCQSSGEWSTDLDKICVPGKMCSTKPFKNGVLIEDCFGVPAVACSYLCSSGYVANAYIPKVTCLKTGNWNTDLDSLCKLDVGCQKKTFPNGKLQDDCSGTTNSMCSYTCNSGYARNSLIQKVTCSSDGQWDSDLDDLCTKESLCNNYIDNGQISDECDRTIGSPCTISCNVGFKPRSDAIICLKTLKWNIAESQACQRPVVTSLHSSTGDKTNPATLYGGIGIVLVVLILVAIAAVVFFKLRRKITKSNPKKKGKYVNSPNMSTNVKEEPNGFTNPVTAHEVPNDYSITDEVETAFDGAPSKHSCETIAEVYMESPYETVNVDVSGGCKTQAVTNPLYSDLTRGASDMTTSEEIIYPRDVKLEEGIDNSPEAGSFDYTKF